MLTVKQAAVVLGVKPATIRAWIYQRRHLEIVRVGRAIRIPRASIDDLIARNTQKIAVKAEVMRTPR